MDHLAKATPNRERDAKPASGGTSGATRRFRSGESPSAVLDNLTAAGMILAEADESITVEIARDTTADVITWTALLRLTIRLGVLEPRPC